MEKPPRHPEEPLLARPEWLTILLTGAVQATVTLAVFAWAWSHRDLVGARNLAFSVLVFGELFRAFAARGQDRLFWEVAPFTNLRVLGVVVISVLIQLGIHHIPATQALFRSVICPSRIACSGWRSGSSPSASSSSTSSCVEVSVMRQRHDRGTVGQRGAHV